MVEEDNEIFIKEMDGFTIKDISSELWRMYIYRSDVRFRINDPLAVYIPHINERGHRVVNKKGEAYWVRPNFIAIEWKNKKGIERVNF